MATATMRPASVTMNARRELSGLTAAAEKRALLWLAARMPAWVSSDVLTLVGFLGTIGAGLSYWRAGSEPLFLHAVNVFVAVNWFGDSLDGTLARHRNRQRPKYGYYVDHMADTLGALILLGGLGLSGLMAPWIAAGLLVAYYLVSINMYLATYALGVFKLSYGWFGGTELRILLIAANLVLASGPGLRLAGLGLRPFDVCGLLAIAGLVGVAMVETVRNTRRLYAAEPLPRR